MKNQGMLFKRVREIKPLGRCAKISLIKSMAVIAVSLTLAYPLIEKGISGETGYYEVSLNGELMGSISTIEEAEEALKEARYQVVKEADSIVYLDPELSFTEVNKWFGETMSKEEITEKMTEQLKMIADFPKPSAYSVKIEDTILYLSSEAEVLELLEGVKNRFDANQKFTVELVKNESNVSDSYTIHITKPQMQSNDKQIVFSSHSSNIESSDDALHAEDSADEVIKVLEDFASAQSVNSDDGVIFIEFEQSIEVLETYVPQDQIVSVQEALDFLTKDKEESQTYEVVSGDCMSVIAEKNEMSLSHLYELNQNVTDDTLLQIGQELVVMVPEPELSVLSKEEVSYKEEYQEPTVYIENDSWYNTEEVVVQEGSLGYHEIVAVVDTRNGREVGREIIQENVVVESLPRIVERGTVAPPTFTWPIYGGSLTSYYGSRWGRLHAGIDYGVSTGTSVFASCAGTVVSAGWSGGYGYCVVIQHSDGKQTRYAHLSKVLVSSGQSVAQGEKIALSGNTGNSTGPHLHFEIIVNGSTVDPLTYLQ